MCNKSIVPSKWVRNLTRSSVLTLITFLLLFLLCENEDPYNEKINININKAKSKDVRMEDLWSIECSEITNHYI